MRKTIAFTLLFSIFIVGITPAIAATKAQTVTTAFKTILNTTGDSLDALEQKYESDIDALDSSLSNSTIAADSAYD